MRKAFYLHHFFSLLLFIHQAYSSAVVSQETYQSKAINTESNHTYKKFLMERSQQRKKSFRYNQYEDLISGSVAFLIGNIGFFTTNSTSLSLAYSGIQTIGIINVGRGAYDFYRPDFEKSLHDLSQDNEIKTKPDVAQDIVRLFAQEEKAKRLALLYTSSLLSTQYFANALIGQQTSGLKSIYYFLGSINLIIVGFSYFSRSPYEAFYEQQKPNEITYSNFQLSPYQNESTESDRGLECKFSYHY